MHTTAYQQKWFSLLLGLLLCHVSSTANGSSQPYLFEHQVNFATGNKYHQETDIALGGPGLPVIFTRTYNSQSEEVFLLGYGWSCNLNERLVVGADSMHMVAPDGQTIFFAMKEQGLWESLTGRRQTVTAVGDQYRLRLPGGKRKTYAADGRLLESMDPNGNRLTYTYTANQLTGIASNFGQALAFSYTAGRLAAVTSPAGSFHFTYDEDDNLTSVTRPDGSMISYLYDDPNDPHNLTGRIDQENRRSFTAVYDAEDRVTSIALMGGLKATTIAYDGAWERTVTNSLGQATTYRLTAKNGQALVDSFIGPGCSSCGSSADTSYTYNNRGQMSSATNAAGAVTEYTYDPDGNLLTMTEAQGTPLERTTTRTYTAAGKLNTYAAPSVGGVDEEKLFTYTYDGAGNLLGKTTSGYDKDGPLSISTTYTYNSTGQPLTIDGPRTGIDDTLTITYYPNNADQRNNRGQLHTMTNCQGHTITYANYTALGMPSTIVDANGGTITRTYDDSGNLVSQAQGGLVTSYTFNKAGDITGITYPGGQSYTYTYAPTGLLEEIAGNSGNSIHYTYDSEGQKTDEEVYDPAGTLQRYAGFAYDEQGRLSKMIMPGGDLHQATYDALGNLVQRVNATGLQTTMSYDQLSRMVTSEEAGATVGYAYDSAGNLVQFTDALNLVTRYTYDDLGRRIARNAPDTGETTYEYDQAGNLITSTDAAGRTIHSAYDSLNRLASRRTDGVTDNFFYDIGPNGTGRLTGTIDNFGQRTLSYNLNGQPLSDTRTINATSYTIAYDWNSSSGQLEALTYPSGMQVAYSRGDNGRIQSITVDGETIISAVTHLPFGPLTHAVLGEVPLNRTYDQRYNLTEISTGSLHRTYTRDPEGHVTGITNLPSPNASDATVNYTYKQGTNQLAWASGNLQKTYTQDPVGNTISDGRFTYTYDGLNRLTRVEQGSTLVAEYGYDVHNRRIYKATTSQTVHFHYDTNGLLLAETTSDGTPLREYIYIGNEPIALKVYDTAPGIYYFLNDHLGSPQQLITATGTIAWQAAYLPFGQAQILQETVTNNLRFPGQYFDEETGLHYNWNRYYDPATGRYISADPIGLEGGMNLYAYANLNPVNFSDPKGLELVVPDLTMVFPKSKLAAPIAQVAIGGVELGIGLTNGVAGIALIVSGPQYWLMAQPFLISSPSLVFSGYTRIKDGIESLEDRTCEQN